MLEVKYRTASQGLPRYGFVLFLPVPARQVDDTPGYALALYFDAPVRRFRRRSLLQLLRPRCRQPARF